MAWRREKVRTRQTERCPVCKSVFGTRYKDEIAEWACQECRHFFKFIPNDPIPKAIHMDKKNTKCGCGRCGD